MSDYTLTPYAVLVEDADTGQRWETTVRALGPNDARNQARQDARDRGMTRPAVLAVTSDPISARHRALASGPVDALIDGQPMYTDGTMGVAE